MTLQEIYDLIALTPEEFLKQCKITNYQASGAGGQKRNRKYSAVRLTHVKSGYTATASEFREPKRNLSRAIRKLRLEIALEFPLINLKGDMTETPLSLFRVNVNENHPDFPACVLVAYHIFYLKKAVLGEAAKKLGTGSAALIRFFKKDKTLFRKVQELRKENNHFPLK